MSDVIATPSLSLQRDGPIWMEFLNVSRQALLAARVDIADSSATRRKGLLGRDRLAADEGLWIVPCGGIHTIGMRFPVDLVYLDRGLRVRKLRSDVVPWRISVCLWAHSVVELAAGTIRVSQTCEGDQMNFAVAAEPRL